MRKAGKRDPRQRSEVNHVIKHGRLQASTSSSHVVHCAPGITYELFKIDLIIKIRVGKALIWQQHRGAAVHRFIDKHPSIFEPVAEWFYFVCDSKGEVMEGQRNPDGRPVANERHEVCNVDVGAYVEVRIRITNEKFKQLSPRP